MTRQLITLFTFSALLLFAVSCKQESVDERIMKEVKLYTEKYCPTPPQDNTILDSMTFDVSTRTIKRYFRLVGKADHEAKTYEDHRQEMHNLLVESVKNDTNTKLYKDAGISFAFIYHSEKDPTNLLFQDIVTEKDYK